MSIDLIGICNELRHSFLYLDDIIKYLNFNNVLPFLTLP